MADKRVKMIAFDLDGTVLTSEKQITEYTASMLAKAIKQGIIVLPATGRPFSGIPKEILEFPGIRYVLSANGARVVDIKKEEVLLETLVSYENGKRLLEIFKKYDALLEIYYDGIGYANEADLERIHYFLPEPPMADYIRSTRRPVKDVLAMFHECQRATDKVQALFSNQKEKQCALQEIAESSIEVEVTGALVSNIEVNAKGVNKGNVLLELGKILGISRDEIMAFGDGDNDIEMLKAAGIGVAMKNGRDLVRKAADVITCSNDEDGVAKVIAKYVL